MAARRKEAPEKAKLRRGLRVRPVLWGLAITAWSVKSYDPEKEHSPRRIEASWRKMWTAMATPAAIKAVPVKYARKR